MSIDINHDLANILLDEYTARFPADSVLEIRTGSPPGAQNMATGTLLVEITLPATPWGAASGGTVAKAGVWSAQAIDSGEAGYFRLRSDDDSYRDEGTITLTGDGGALTLDNVNIANTQTVTISTFTRSI